MSFKWANPANTAILRIADGRFIPVAPGNLDYVAVLDWVSKGNVIAPFESAQESLHAAAERKCDKVDAFGTTLRERGCPYQGKFIQVRPVDVGNITAKFNRAMASKAGLLPWTPIYWIMADDSLIPIATADDMIALGDATERFVEQVIFAGATHKRNVRLLTNLAEVDGYDHTIGWPA